MHLAYLHYLYGGDTALNHARQFTEAARGLGHRVDLHAMNLAPDTAETGSGPQTLASRLRQALKHRFSYLLHEPKELLWNLPYSRKETDLLRRDPPEVLLVRDHLITSSCVVVARRLGLPLVLEVNAPAAESGMYMDQYLHLPFLSEGLERWKLRRADGVTVVSGALREFLVTTHGLEPDKVVVVPNGADIARFHPAVTPDPELPERFRSGPVVGFVGSFETWHGTDLLADMAREVGHHRPDAGFLFVGDGPEAPGLRRATAELGNRVVFTGRVEHHRVPALVAAFDIGVVAQAAFYMCPLKALEWMAAGRAVVAPRQGPLEELIDHEVHGLLFEPRNPAALVDAVTRLIDDPALRRRLGAAAAERARGSLSWSDNAARVLAVCAEAKRRHSEREARRHLQIDAGD